LNKKNVNADRSIRLINITPQTTNRVACIVGFKRSGIWKYLLNISITFGQNDK
jgi:hypothetical protein